MWNSGSLVSSLKYRKPRGNPNPWKITAEISGLISLSATQGNTVVLTVRISSHFSLSNFSLISHFSHSTIFSSQFGLALGFGSHFGARISRENANNFCIRLLMMSWETEFHIEPELTLELMMAANYLHTWTDSKYTFLKHLKSNYVSPVLIVLNLKPQFS